MATSAGLEGACEARPEDEPVRAGVTPGTVGREAVALARASVSAWSTLARKEASDSACSARWPASVSAAGGAFGVAAVGGVAPAAAAAGGAFGVAAAAA